MISACVFKCSVAILRSDNLFFNASEATQDGKQDSFGVGFCEGIDPGGNYQRRVLYTRHCLLSAELRLVDSDREQRDSGQSLMTVESG